MDGHGRNCLVIQGCRRRPYSAGSGYALGGVRLRGRDFRGLLGAGYSYGMTARGRRLASRQFHAQTAPVQATGSLTYQAVTNGCVGLPRPTVGANLN